MKKILIITVLMLAITGLLVAQMHQGKGNEQGNGPMMNKADNHCAQMDAKKSDCNGNCDKKGSMQGHPRMQKGHGPMMDQPMMFPKEINLTAAQKEQLEKMHVDMKKRMNSMQAEMKNLQIDERNATKNEKWDEAKKIAEQINAKRTEMHKARIDMMSRTMSILTAEQKAQLKKIREEGPKHECMEKAADKK